MVKLVPGEIPYLKSGSDFRAPALSARGRSSSGTDVPVHQRIELLPLPGTALLGKPWCSRPALRASGQNTSRSNTQRTTACRGGAQHGKREFLRLAGGLLLFVCSAKHRGQSDRTTETRHKSVQGHRWVTPAGFKGKGAWAPSPPWSITLSSCCLAIQSGICYNVTLPL